MGTRSLIVVTGRSLYGGASTTRLYKGSDGYPTDTLDVIERAISKANNQVKEQNEKWGDNKASINHSQLVGLIIGESTSTYGQGAVVEKQYEKPLNENRHLGNQWDVEWIYIVDTDLSTVRVYGGGCATPKNHISHGPTDPTSYAECLRDEYQEEERKEIKNLIKKIEKQGFKLNPKSKNLKLVA